MPIMTRPRSIHQRLRAGLRAVMPVAIPVAIPVVCVLCVLHARPALAQQPEAKAATAASGASASAAAAAPDKVYPPLPSLAMLPPPSAADSDDEAPPRKTNSRKKGVKEKVRNEMPVPHMVVSDATRTYLNAVEQDIEHAMPK
jgi:hypothetical protein